MDERPRTTKFTRHARTRRMLDRLGEGRAYAEVAREEGLTERRVRQIVAKHLKRREAADEGTHANVQIDRLGFAIKVAGEALAQGDLRAVAPFIKAIEIRRTISRTTNWSASDDTLDGAACRARF